MDVPLKEASLSVTRVSNFTSSAGNTLKINSETVPESIIQQSEAVISTSTKLLLQKSEATMMSFPIAASKAS